jgi:hypothetical protein
VKVICLWHLSPHWSQATSQSRILIHEHPVPPNQDSEITGREQSFYFLSDCNIENQKWTWFLIPLE